MSSLRVVTRACRGDPPGLPVMSEWFEQMPAKDLEAAPQAMAEPDASIERLRIDTQRGHPLSGDTFLSEVETLLARRIRPLPIGRQKGWRKGKTKQEPSGEDDK
jgi:hypothetical protein